MMDAPHLPDDDESAGAEHQRRHRGKETVHVVPGVDERTAGQTGRQVGREDDPDDGQGDRHGLEYPARFLQAYMYTLDIFTYITKMLDILMV